MVKIKVAYPRVVQVVLARDVLISEIAIPAVTQANLGGADLVILTGPNHKPGQKLMVKPETKRREDLKGKRIGITRFGTSDNFAPFGLGQWSLQPDRDVDFDQMAAHRKPWPAWRRAPSMTDMLSSPLHFQAAKSGYHLLAT